MAQAEISFMSVLLMTFVEIFYQSMVGFMLYKVTDDILSFEEHSFIILWKERIFMVSNCIKFNRQKDWKRFKSVDTIVSFNGFKESKLLNYIYL